jgi:hypothetical protein
MNPLKTRRDLVRLGAFSAILGSTSVASASLIPNGNEKDQGKLWQGYPRQDQKLVAEVVGVSHFNEPRVKELVKAYPELVNAWWDWGFGDWESPLGAAAHVGHRGIAEFLLSHGARIDIFAAAMMGFTSVVKAFVSSQPGVQRTFGPHGITLLAHAKAGGKPAADTVEYLKHLGDADQGLKTTSLEDKNRQRYLGEFASKEHPLKMVCKLNKAGRLVVDFFAGETQSTGRLIHYLGNDTFFPAGVPSVQLRYTMDGQQAATVTISGSVPDLKLLRSGG